jgi:hypothetical protein
LSQAKTSSLLDITINFLFCQLGDSFPFFCISLTFNKKSFRKNLIFFCVNVEGKRQLGRKRRRRMDSTLLVIFKKWSRAMQNLNLLLDRDRSVGAEEYPALFQKTEG